MKANKKYFIIVLAFACLLTLLTMFKTENVSTEISHVVNTTVINATNKIMKHVLTDSIHQMQETELPSCAKMPSLLGKFAIKS